MSKKRLAIFDIDGTVFRSSLLIELVDALIYEGIFKPDAAKIYERDKRKWLDREGNYETYIANVVKAFRKNLKGVRYGDFLRVANEVVALHKNRVYRFTRNLVKELKGKGYYLAAISHSPRIIVGSFAEKMGFDKVYGFRYEIDSKKKFIGESRRDDPILDKAKILERILERSL